MVVVFFMSSSSLSDEIAPSEGNVRGPSRRSSRAREAVLRAADDLLVGRAGGRRSSETLMDTFLEEAESALATPDTGRPPRTYASISTHSPIFSPMLRRVG